MAPTTAVKIEEADDESRKRKASASGTEGDTPRSRRRKAREATQESSPPAEDDGQAEADAGAGEDPQKDSEKPPEESSSDDDSEESSDDESEDDPEKAIISILTERIWTEDAKKIKAVLKRLNNLLQIKSEQGEEKANFKKNSQAAYSNGAPMAVCQTMRRFSGNEGIQVICIGLFVNMAYYHKSGDVYTKLRQDLITQGALKVCLSAMEQFPEDPTMAHKGCSLLGHMMANEAIIKQVVDAGGLKRIVSAIKDHPTNGQVQRYGCYALRHLLGKSSTDYGEKVMELGAIKLLVNTFTNHSGNQWVLEHACKALKFFAKDNAAHQKLLIDAKGLVAVATVISNPQVSEDTKKVAKETLHAICPP